MSNYLAIAHVMAAVHQRITQQLSVVTGISPLNVSVGAPEETSVVLPSGGGGVRLCAYHVAPNAALRNADLPTRSSSGMPLKRPVAAYDVHFLISFYGDRATLIPERLMGATLMGLHGYPVLNDDILADADDPSDFSFLSASDLARQIDRITLTPLPMTLEEMNRLWGMLTQDPYVPSVAWQASVVLLEKEVHQRRSLPVRTPVITTAVLGGPTLTSVENSEEDAAVVYDSSLVLTGKGLRGDTTTVRLWSSRGTVSVTSLTSTRPTRIELSLSGLDVLSLADDARLSPGVWALRVEHPIFRSGTIPFVLHPAIAWGVSGLTNPAVSASVLSIWVRPALTADQRARIHLRRTDFASLTDATARVFVFDETVASRLESDTGLGEPADWQKLVFTTSGLTGGVSYVLQLEVDGVFSVPDLSATPVTPTVTP